MLRDELVELLSPQGLTLLDSLPPYESQRDVVKLVASLRGDGHSPALVAAVLTQARLRAKAGGAGGKFGEFSDRMLFTEAGLEQATRLSVAARHAARYRDAGIRLVADLGCGIGGDAMALAALGLAVTAVDRDEVTAAIASYNLAPFPDATVEQGDAESFDISHADGLWLDPARRTAGHSDTRRLADSDDWSPSLDWVFNAASRMPVGVKLGPGFDRDLIPGSAEAQWVSYGGQVVELVLWFGALARPGVTRAALVLDASGAHELTAPEDSADEPVGELGEFLYEPDGAVIRARLIGDLARSLDGRMLSEGIAYVTADESRRSPFAQGFRIVERLAYHEKDLKAELRRRGIGTLEIKKRGVDVDPAKLRTRLALKGKAAATLILTRVAGRHTALLAERLS
ncbi:THUMP-like domain-containing protein [Gryllotalpicola protaetiae]|uniref:SAM-dependent methyltransferase n=1 Tax=Gryllotalpicola protaetiae TaxID=2419771 RepID=A0A387BX71_9MICO|nr:SAM-dependent methyltransferase [Gryllotalpicola protaetiae]AYG02941.1 SAM-dependent methyltransferase [Gryllotalpicola protaetiae]